MQVLHGDMAEITQVEDCLNSWSRPALTTDEGDGITPITYMNSAAAIKAFCGEAWRVVCTSSMRRGRLSGCGGQGVSAPQGSAPQQKILFLPDQHLAATLDYNWNRAQRNGGVGSLHDQWRTHDGTIAHRQSDLWKGHCSVHQRFCPSTWTRFAPVPDIRVIVHPECRWEVCQRADGIGSTEGLLKMIRQAPAARCSLWDGIHLVNRMGKEFAAEGKKVITLDDSGCLCTTISASHRSICAGRWKTWRKATSSIRSK